MIYSDMDVRGGDPVVLTVPGLGGSGPDHWQTVWEETRGDCRRVDLGEWNAPRRDLWVSRLDAAVADVGPPVILVAHSLGCLAVAWAAQLDPQPYGWPVVGALLVAPPDVEGFGCPGGVRGFAPTPHAPLPFPSVLVASRDDPYATIQRSRDMAGFWGSHFVDAGTAGHLNADSGLGGWRYGQQLLDNLIAGLARSTAIRPQASLSAGEWDAIVPAAAAA